jgi:transmembrane sensor
MSSAPNEDDRLFEEAMNLMIRLQSDPANPVAHEMAQDWRARSAAHERVWGEVVEIHGLAGNVLKKQRSAAQRTKLGLTRRNLMLGGGAVVLAGAGYAALPWALRNLRAEHMTGTAQLSRIKLADGSVATLGPDTAVATAYTQALRRVELLAGMAFFHVAEGDRPFEVAAADMTATARAGAFDISIDDGYVSLGVDRGAVGLLANGAVPRFDREVTAGRWVSVNDASFTAEEGERGSDQIGAWRDGLIVAERETVSAVIARIARWLPGRVVVADPELAQRRVNGVFDVAQPVNALQAVVHPFGGKVRQLTGYLTVISPF